MPCSGLTDHTESTRELSFSGVQLTKSCQFLKNQYRYAVHNEKLTDTKDTTFVAQANVDVYIRPEMDTEVRLFEEQIMYLVTLNS